MSVNIPPECTCPAKYASFPMHTVSCALRQWEDKQPVEKPEFHSRFVQIKVERSFTDPLYYGGSEPFETPEQRFRKIISQVEH